MSQVTTARMTLAEARDLTDEVKGDAAALWAKLLRLYEGGAHIAIGYSSWAEYCAEEFDLGKSRSYQVLDAARVVAALPQSTNGGTANERAVRELAPVLRQEGAETVADAYEEAVERHGPQPTAAQVREVVRGRKDEEEFTLTVQEPDNGEVTMEFLEALAAEYGLEVVGAPPSGDDELSQRAERAKDELPMPTDERVIRRLARTAQEDPERAIQIWEQAYAQHGENATAAEVAVIAAQHPPSAPWEEDMRKLTADLRRFVRTKDPKDARRALVRWRPAYKVLNEAARADQ
jgi:hypothetical protein